MARPMPADDPFEFPVTIIPRGLSYQWCAKTVMGEPSEQFNRMIAGGWLPVPISRHPGVFRTADRDGSVEVMGQLLMYRSKGATDTSREKENDQAYLNRGSGRLINLVVDLPFVLSAPQMREAHQSRKSSSQYVVEHIKRIAEGFDSGSVLGFMSERDSWEERRGLTFIEFARRRPRHRWLAWLFNLISTEQ